jgi:hypothetical protein
MVASPFPGIGDYSEHSVQSSFDGVEDDMGGTEGEGTHFESSRYVDGPRSGEYVIEFGDKRGLAFMRDVEVQNQNLAEEGTISAENNNPREYIQ